MCELVFVLTILLLFSFLPYPSRRDPKTSATGGGHPKGGGQEGQKGYFFKFMAACNAVFMTCPSSHKILQIRTGIWPLVLFENAALRLCGGRLVESKPQNFASGVAIRSTRITFWEACTQSVVSNLESAPNSGRFVPSQRPLGHSCWPLGAHVWNKK